MKDYKEIKRIIIDVFRENAIEENIEFDEKKSFSEMGLNSLLYVKCIVNIEDRLQMEFDDESLDFANMVTIDQICIKAYEVINRE